MKKRCTQDKLQFVTGNYNEEIWPIYAVLKTC